MSIAMNALCINCLLGKHVDNARSLGSEEQAMAFSKAVMQLIIDAKPTDNSTLMAKRINNLYMTHYGLPQDRFTEEKRISNQFVMDWLAGIRQRVEAADDPIYTGLQYAILGNYIDFSALGKSVSFEKLEEMLRHPEDFPVDEATYQDFLQDLSQAKTLLYITDNAGEICFDMVLAQQLQKQYPDLTITFCVRGGPSHNDATREDAKTIGLPFPVIDSGCDIGGMELDQIGPEAKAAFESADIILAKGMGNTEGLYGCGYNVYLAFLIKCPRLAQVFGKPHMTSMFVKGK